MDRYERMRSGDWPPGGATSNFRRMPEHGRLWQWQRELLADAGRITLALALLALLAALAG
jgi:hypothetical protein